ncbi:MAG: hypothetical protein ACMUEM_05525 [Flavobacteriales bacterium AspAUS03]
MGIFYDVFEKVQIEKILVELESCEGDTQSLSAEEHSSFEKLSPDQIPSGQDLNEIPGRKYNLESLIKGFNWV